jgi:hypothetical protein
MKRVIGGIAAIGAIAATSIAAGSVAAQADETVTLLHGVPGVPVDVWVDGAVAFPDFQPEQTQDLSQFRGDTLADVQLFVAGTTNAVTDPPVDLAVPDSGSWTVIAHLDASSAVVISSFENNTAATATEGNGRLTVRHAAALGAVDLVVGDQRPISGLASGEQGEVELAAGTVSGAQLALAGEAPTVPLPDIDIAAGANLIVYAVGPNADDDLEFYTQTAAIEVPATTTTVAESTTTSGPTTTTDPNATTTTVESTTTLVATTTTVEAVPTAVNTGSPLDSSLNLTLVVIALGGVFLAGTALLARRRVG